MKKTTLLLSHRLARRTCLRAALGFLAALALGPHPARAAVTEAWVQRYNNVPSNSTDQAVKVVRDAAGDITVIGSTEDGTTGADGTVIWQKRYNGPRNYTDFPTAVAVDGSGNVVVTGNSQNGPPNHDNDYYTAKYAAADGALLWEKRYNDGSASSLALGPNGMVAVTGSSSGDYATVVYREIPPPLSFAAWAACSGLSGVAAAADADPDSDGMPNSAEYILGGNPTAPGTSGSPTATTSGGNTVITFPRDDVSETPDVTLTVEAGTDLLTWPAVFHIGPNTIASSPGVSITENGTAPDTITVTIPQGTHTRIFARLKVTIAP